LLRLYFICFCEIKNPSFLFVFLFGNLTKSNTHRKTEAAICRSSNTPRHDTTRKDTTKTRHHQDKTPPRQDNTKPRQHQDKTTPRQDTTKQDKTTQSKTNEKNGEGFALFITIICFYVGGGKCGGGFV